MTNKQWSVLFLMLAEGLTQRSIAERLGITQRAVEYQVARIRKRTIGELLDKITEQRVEKWGHPVKYEEWQDDKIREKF